MSIAAKYVAEAKRRKKTRKHLGADPHSGAILNHEASATAWYGSSFPEETQLFRFEDGSFMAYNPNVDYCKVLRTQHAIDEANKLMIEERSASIEAANKLMTEVKSASGATKPSEQETRVNQNTIRSMPTPFGYGPLRVYIAGSYDRRGELDGYAFEVSERDDYTVVSTWHEHERYFMTRDWDKEWEHRRTAETFAMRDIERLARADVLIAFTEDAEGNPAVDGPLVATGMALAWQKWVILVGPITDFFCNMTQRVEALPKWTPEVFASMPHSKTNYVYRHPLI